MAFIEDSAPQENAGRQLSTRIFCGTGFYKRREKNHKEKKKDDPSLAIGENYINKMFLFCLCVSACLRAYLLRHADRSFNFLFMDVFTYR